MNCVTINFLKAALLILVLLSCAIFVLYFLFLIYANMEMSLYD